MLMHDFCRELRYILCDHLLDAGIAAAPEDICLRCGDCEAAYAFRADIARPQAPKCRHAWLSAAEVRGNRICFYLSGQFYRETAAHILSEKLALLPHSIKGTISYARARMCMLARKGGEAFDARLKKAFWRALTANEDGLPEKTRSSLMLEAAQDALLIGKDVPLSKRQSYFESCGMAAGCIARLLCDEN